MDILDLIKRRTSVRKYKDKPIPKDVLDKILEAGIWGPSVLHRQPWKFVVIKDKNVFQLIRDVMYKMSEKKNIGIRAVTRSSANVILGSAIVICAYLTNEVVAFSGKFYSSSIEQAKYAEISSLAACFQNMILMAETLGIGTCWFDVPSLYSDEIASVINYEGSIFAVLTLGYPAENGKRSKRKEKEKLIFFLNKL